MIRPSIVALARLRRHRPARETTESQHEAISNQRKRRQEPSRLQRFPLVHRHVGIDLQHRVEDVDPGRCCLRATYYIDIGICRLRRGDLAWDSAASTLPPELLLDESLQLEVQEVDISGAWLDVVDTVLVLVTIAGAHSHDRGVQICCGIPLHLGHLLRLTHQFLSILDLGGALDRELTHMYRWCLTKHHGVGELLSRGRLHVILLTSCFTCGIGWVSLALLAIQDFLLQELKILAENFDC